MPMHGYFSDDANKVDYIKGAHMDILTGPIF